MLVLLILLLLLHLLQLAQELFRRLHMRLLALIFLPLRRLRLLLVRTHRLRITWCRLLLLWLLLRLFLGRLFLRRLFLFRRILFRNGHIFGVAAVVRLLLLSGRRLVRRWAAWRIRQWRLHRRVRSRRENNSLHGSGLSHRTKNDVVIPGTVQKRCENVFGLSRAEVRNDSVGSTHGWLLDRGAGHSPYGGEYIIHG